MRIVFVSPVAKLGGAERSLLDLLGSLKATWPSAALHLLAFEDGPLLELARSEGATTEVLPLPADLRSLGEATGPKLSALFSLVRAFGCGPKALSYALTLRRRLSQLAPDVIHTNGMKAHALGALGRTRHSKLVWHLRDYLSQRRVMRHLLPLLCFRAHAILANSRGVAEDAEQLFRNVPIFPLLNAIDTHYFRPGLAAGDLDRLGGVEAPAAGTLRVGLVATFAAWKGHSVFLAAAKRVRMAEASPNARFYIIGGPLYSTISSQRNLRELQAEASALNLGPSVVFVPFQDDVAPVYGALDIVVHASTSPEPFGRAIAEAMACGCPVIATTHCGAASLIEDRRNGFLVKPGDPEELARAVIELLESETLRRSSGQQARATAERFFARERLGKEVLRCYSELFDGKLS
jgi:glycosyltransferase involved in cell wall biosynthesis